MKKMITAAMVALLALSSLPGAALAKTYVYTECEWYDVVCMLMNSVSPLSIYTADYGTPVSEWIGGGYGTIEYVGGRDLSVLTFDCRNDVYTTATFCFVGIVAGSRNTYVPTTEYGPSMTMIKIGDSYRAQIGPNQGAYLWYRYYTTCGNAVCDTAFGETASSCPSDCGASATTTTTTIFTPPWGTTTTTVPTTTTLPVTTTTQPYVPPVIKPKSLDAQIWEAIAYWLKLLGLLG